MELNVSVLDKVATWLEAGAPHTQTRGMKFDMGPLMVIPEDQFTNEHKPKDNWCGTACCIAGAAVVLGDPEALDAILQHPKVISGQSYYFGVWDKALMLCELYREQASQLFEPWDYTDEDDELPTGWPQSSSVIDPAWAAKVIRHLIKTGTVEWDILAH